MWSQMKAMLQRVKWRASLFALALFLLGTSEIYATLFARPNASAPPAFATGFTAREGYSKVLLMKYRDATAPPSIDFLNGMDADLLTEYQAVDLAYVAQNIMDTLRSRAMALGVPMQIRDDFDVISTYPRIDARLGLARSAPDKTPDPPYATNAYGLYLVQFMGPIKEDWMAEVRSMGVVFVQYYPYNALVVAGRPSVMPQVASLPFIQFCEQWHTFLKPVIGLSPDVLTIRIDVAITADTPALVERLSALSLRGVKTYKANDVELAIIGDFDPPRWETIKREPLVFFITALSSIAPSGPGAPPPSAPANIPTLGPHLLAALCLVIAAVALLRMR
jgi:hypothetical protein